MKRTDTMRNDLAAEFISKRVENGVEIIERETREVIRLVDDRYVTEAPAEKASPRLVISDAPEQAGVYISKTRSEIGNLDTLLRSLVRSPVHSK